MEGTGAALRLRHLRHLTISVGVEVDAAVARGFGFLDLNAVLLSLRDVGDACHLPGYPHAGRPADDPEAMSVDFFGNVEVGPVAPMDVSW